VLVVVVFLKKNMLWCNMPWWEGSFKVTDRWSWFKERERERFTIYARRP